MFYNLVNIPHFAFINGFLIPYYSKLLKFTSYLLIHLIFVFVLAKFTPIPFSVRFPFFTFSFSCPFYKCIYFCHFIISPMFPCSFLSSFCFFFLFETYFRPTFPPSTNIFISTSLPFSLFLQNFDQYKHSLFNYFHHIC